MAAWAVPVQTAYEVTTVGTIRYYMKTPKITVQETKQLLFGDKTKRIEAYRDTYNRDGVITTLDGTSWRVTSNDVQWRVERTMERRHGFLWLWTETIWVGADRHGFPTDYPDTHEFRAGALEILLYVVQDVDSNWARAHATTLGWKADPQVRR